MTVWKSIVADYPVPLGKAIRQSGSGWLVAEGDRAVMCAYDTSQNGSLTAILIDFGFKEDRVCKCEVVITQMPPGVQK